MTAITPSRRALAEAIDALLEVTIVGSFSHIGYLARCRLFGWESFGSSPMLGRTALVTGASSGLGFATAHGLARLGATVVLLGRDEGRTEAARASILGDLPQASVEVVLADLSHLGDVRRAAETIGARYDRLDVIVHNAGTLVHDHQLTDDGIELTAQTHVLAPFLLTASLLPLLTRTSGSRVIHVASGGMYTAQLSVDALDAPGAQDFDGVAAYARAKRAAVVLAEQWATRTANDEAHGVTFHAMHPGWADTPGVRSALPAFYRAVGPLLRSPDEGVDTTLWLAASDEALRSNGRFWLDRHQRRTSYLPRTSTTPAEAQRLWQWCLDRAGIDDPTAAPAGPASRPRGGR